jgi:hypothetical protein
MTSRLMLLAGAAALVLTSASAEPQHSPKCPPGQQNCVQDQQGGNQGAQPSGQKRGQQSGPQGQQGGPQQGGQQSSPQGSSHNPQAGVQSGPQGGQAFQGGQKGVGDRNWQDSRGSWHRDHDRYWRQDFRGGFAARDRLFSVLRQHQYNRFDGDPYWFNGRFVVRTFDRRGRPVTVELNPYTGAFIGIVRF